MTLTSSLSRIIQSHLEKDKLNHAYLLSGPGRKIKTAFGFTRAILGQKFRQHPDFIILEKEEDSTQIKINQVRGVIRRISLRSSGKRVVLIKKAELLSLDAANALLKTLEEPPAGTIFILTTANIREIIPTIISRCQNIYLPETGAKFSNSGRERALSLRGKWIKDFLATDLIRRFELIKEISGTKGDPAKIISGLQGFLREEMLKEADLKKRKRIAREIREISASRLLLKRNVSAKLILEDLSLRLKRR